MDDALGGKAQINKCHAVFTQLFNCSIFHQMGEMGA